VANEIEDQTQGSVGAWAKRYYFAVRATMESVLRPYDLGTTQWYVLYQLANDGPTRQRDLVRMLQIELRITDAGMKLWEELPDPLALIREIAFDGSDAAELATALRVLQAATQRLNDDLAEDNKSSVLKLSLPYQPGREGPLSLAGRTARTPC
jgi:DNA-binding MarR family transcriptional regulator